MDRRYDSFLVRCWSGEPDEPRIEVEHIQSGRRAHVASLALATAWMSSSWGDTQAATGERAGEAK